MQGGEFKRKKSRDIIVHKVHRVAIINVYISSVFRSVLFIICCEEKSDMISSLMHPLFLV